MPKYIKNPKTDDSQMVNEFRCFEDNGEQDSLYYFRFKMPMMSERDNVCRISVNRLENDVIFMKMVSIEHKDFPAYPNRVRIF